ncbi:MAG: phage tail protein [Pseudomonas sp.]|uniref:phage tail protein n=1 Tax=Pseudomonas sp. TaxID=306 RepID=UPI003BB50105
MRQHDFFPVGAVLAYAGPLASTDQAAGLNLELTSANLARAGWLFCNGASLPCAAFKELFDIIGNAFGSKQQGYFNLPDLRGRFVRGVDGGSGNDPEAGKRKVSAAQGNAGDQVGSLQTDAFQGHEHNYIDMIAGTIPAQPGGETPAYIPNPTPTATTDVDAVSGDGTPRVSSETRPLNLYLNYIIRYRHCVGH